MPTIGPRLVDPTEVTTNSACNSKLCIDWYNKQPRGKWLQYQLVLELGGGGGGGMWSKPLNKPEMKKWVAQLF